MTAFLLKPKTGTVYDTAPDAWSAAKAAGYQKTAIVRLSPVDGGFIVRAVRADGLDLYLVEGATR